MSDKKLLLKDLLLSKVGFNEVEFEILGEKVLIREMTAKEANTYENSMYSVSSTGAVKVTTERVKSMLVQKCVRDMNGAKVFEKTDLDLIEEFPANVINTLYVKCLEVCGMATKLDNAVKN